jgi:hypothetical protein
MKNPSASTIYPPQCFSYVTLIGGSGALMDGFKKIGNAVNFILFQSRLKKK